MKTIELVGEKFFKLRDYTPIPIIILAIIFAEPTVASYVAGLLIALFGEFTRIYGVAFIGTISRTRSYSNGELIQAGPFSALRNPLYFGNLVLIFGLSIMPGIFWLPYLVVGLFYIQYIPIVAWEEMKLRNIFGESYVRYCEKVPNRWFPRAKKMFSGECFVKPDSWKPALKSEKRTFTSFVVYIIVMAVLLCYQLDTGNLPFVK